jgi:hypothetical protein
LTAQLRFPLLTCCQQLTCSQVSFDPSTEPAKVFCLDNALHTGVTRIPANARRAHSAH